MAFMFLNKPFLNDAGKVDNLVGLTCFQISHHTVKPIIVLHRGSNDHLPV